MHRIFLIAPWIADFGHGILIATAFLYFTHGEPTLWFYLLAIVFSVLPDLDGVQEFLKFRNIGASQGRATDHRDGLHFPLLWLLTGIGFYYLNPLLGGLFIACTLAHFINDSWGTGWGVQWLWPLSHKSYKLLSRHEKDADISTTHVVVSWDTSEKKEVMETQGNPNWLHDIYLRPTIISIVEYGTFVLSLLVLGTFLFLR